MEDSLPPKPGQDFEEASFNCNTSEGEGSSKVDEKETSEENADIKNNEAEVVEMETESGMGADVRDCCMRNLNNCCGDNVRGVRDCCCCLGRASKEVYHDCRHLECKQCMSDTFTLDNLRRKFPFTLWLPKYRLKHFFGDVIAGLTVGLTALPQGLAYAKIANLPPQYGLYSLFMPCFAYLIFGTAKDVSIGPTAVMSLLTGEYADSPIEGDPTYAIVLAMMTGIIQFVMGVLHLGFLVNYISHPVVNAFTMVSVVTISISQIPKWLGLQDVPRDFIHQVYTIFQKLPETQIPDFVLGLVCMIIIFLMKKMKSSTCMKSPTNSRIVKVARYFVWISSTAKNALVVLGSALLAAILMEHGMEPFTLTGYIPPGLPPFKPPEFSVSDGNTTYTAEDIFKQLGTGLIIVPLIGLVETVAIGKSFARIGKYKVEPNQELLALGVGNLLGSFVSGYPVTGSFSRSSVNYQGGCRTTGAGFWTATLVLLVVAFLTPVFSYIPDATLAAVIIMALLDIADFTLLIELWDVKKIDLLPWIITFVFSLLLGVETGLLLGIGASLCILLYPPARPKFKKVCDVLDESKSEMEPLKIDYAMLEVTHGLSFPAVDHFSEHVLNGMEGENTVYRSVILDFVHVTTIDSSVTRTIEQLCEDFALAGVKLVLCQVQPQVLKVILKAHIKHLIHTPTRADALVALMDDTAANDDMCKIIVAPTRIVDSKNDEVHKTTLDTDFLQKQMDDYLNTSISSLSDSTSVVTVDDVQCEVDGLETMKL